MKLKKEDYEKGTTEEVLRYYKEYDITEQCEKCKDPERIIQWIDNHKPEKLCKKCDNKVKFKTKTSHIKWL